MIEIVLLLIKVVFIIVIYLFIFGVIRLIYLDIKSVNISKTNAMGSHPYLKLINQRDMLGFKVEENYTLDRSVTIGRQDKNDIVPYAFKTIIKNKLLCSTFNQILC